MSRIQALVPPVVYALIERGIYIQNLLRIKCLIRSIYELIFGYKWLRLNGGMK